MNEELKILTSLMNRGGEGAQALSNPDDPTDIEPVSMEQTFQPEVQGGEVELTQEMKNNMPVVNKARDGGNPISGAADFLSNPEVQNALINFGQAFANAGNFSGQDNPINQIGNTGKQAIRGQANQRALEAFERGEDPAQAAGRFADPELVTRLQQQLQQGDQFEKEMEVKKESLNIEESALASDTAYKFASLAQNKELATKELELRAEAQEIDERLIDARTDLVKAQERLANARADAAGRIGEEDMRQVAEATTAYLETLNERERNIQDQIDTTNSILDEYDRGFTDWNVNEEWIRKQALEQGVKVTDAEGNVDLSIAKENLKGHLNTLQTRLNTVRDQQDILSVAQTQRLGLGGSGGDEDTNSAPTPRGTPESPVTVSTYDDLTNLPPGSYGKSEITGETYIIDENGQPRPLNNQDNE